MNESVQIKGEGENARRQVSTFHIWQMTDFLKSRHTGSLYSRALLQETSIVQPLSAHVSKEYCTEVGPNSLILNIQHTDDASKSRKPEMLVRNKLVGWQGQRLRREGRALANRLEDKGRPLRRGMESEWYLGVREMDELTELNSTAPAWPSLCRAG